MKPPNARRLVGFLALCVLLPACGRHRLAGDEVERNRLFAEIARREDRRDPGNDRFFPQLLSDERQPVVQKWAAVALGRIGEPSALAWLFEASRTAHAAVRAASAFAIGEIEDRDLCLQEGRSPNPRTAGMLARLLSDSSVAVRTRAIEALGKVGDARRVPDIVATMRGFQPAGDPSRRPLVEAAVTAMLRLKGPEAEKCLVSIAQDPDPELQWRALNALIRLQANSACEISKRLIDSPDGYVRAYAARGLGTCKDAAVARRLEALLQPRLAPTGETVPLPLRVCAVQALGKLADAASVAPIARALAADPLDEEHPDQVNFAIQAAATLAAFDPPQSEPVLASLLKHRGPVANSAIVGLGQTMRLRPERFFELLETANYSGPAGVRAVAAALGELGGERAILALKGILIRAALENPQAADVMAIPSVLASLGRTGTPDLASILRIYLASPDPAVLRSALKAYLPVAAGKERWQPLLQAFRALGEADDPETKVAVLEGLQRWSGEPGVREFLAGALRDRSRNARIAAARLLRQQGLEGVPSSPGPADVRAGSSTYAMLAAARQERTIAAVETGRGTIEIHLFREDAPMTVDNFCTLAKRGYFDGLRFMRVVPFFVIQGGDPRNDMEGGPGYSIRCEINMRPFERGSVGMALAGKDTGGSQFFITLAPQPHLDGGYTCFGRVIAGMPVAERMVPGDRIERVRIREERTTMDFRRY